MKKALKKIISLLLVCVTVLTCVPAEARAEVAVESRAAVPAAYQLPKLTGDMAQDVANVASSQIGYSGENGTIYGKWWTGFTGWGYDYTYEAWCGMFASWCAFQAGAKVGVAFNYESAMANGMWNFYKKKGQAVTDFSSKPKAGDFIFTGDASGYCSHVAVVVGFDNASGKVITVGGNQGRTEGGMVTQVNVPWYSGAKSGSKYVLGYGRPKYPTSSGITTPTPTPEPLPTPTPAPNPGPDGFIDVSESDWFYSSVVYAKEHSIMSGLTEDTFAPNQKLSRAQCATILYRLYGSPEVTYKQKFKDVKSGDWYASAVIWASNAGIVSGYGDGTFGSNDNVTREQMATMMYRYANYLALDTVPKMADIEGYSDANKVSAYALDATKWAVGYGLISGTTPTTLNPLGNTSRAECAAIAERFMGAYLMN